MCDFSTQVLHNMGIWSLPDTINIINQINMNTNLLYGIITVLFFVLEIVYFRLAAHFNIIDKPNERSSHYNTPGF